MGRKSRMKKERRELFQKTGGVTDTIELRNPEKQNFGAFVAANSVHWRQDYLDAWEKDGARLHEYRWWDLADVRVSMVKREDALAAIHLPVVKAAVYRLKRDKGVAVENSKAGKTVAICGAGPSLSENTEWIEKADEVWGCNSALTWLLDHGYKVTHGFSVDQTPVMLQEWKTTPDVEYLLASTVHPHLTELLRSRGRKITWFHNYAGIKGPQVEYDGESLPYEDYLYSLLYPATIRCGSGLNSVNRAIDLAQFMGYEKIYVLGADCAIRTKRPCPNVPAGHPEHLKWLEESTVMHADGGSAVVNGQSSLTMEGVIDGRRWLSKPDMIVSSVWLELTRRQFPDQIIIVGDTLPNALRDKPVEFLKRLPAITNAEGKSMLPLPEEAA